MLNIICRLNKLNNKYEVFHIVPEVVHEVRVGVFNKESDATRFIRYISHFYNKELDKTM